MTIVEWIDIFSRKEQRDLIVAALKYCISEKGLNVYAYCIMTNHIHLIVNCNEPFQLKDTIRDFKKFTSKAILREIKSGIESRRSWLLELFEKAGSKTAKNKTYKVWQTGIHAIELYSQKFTWNKVNYIHQNPVEAGFVGRAEDWSYSSASNYMESDLNMLDEICCLTSPTVTVD
jgi:REP element-mobilizing transposase RayT